MSMFREKSILYIAFVKEHLDGEMFEESRSAPYTWRACPTSRNSLRELFAAKNHHIKSIAVSDGCATYDSWGDVFQSEFFVIDCVTEADALSVQNDIDNWNEEQTEDCFAYFADENSINRAPPIENKYHV